MQDSKKFAMAGVLLAAMCSGALGAVLIDAVRLRAQGADVVTTTQVNLVDDTGQLRAVIASRDERRMTFLSFLDASGQVRGIVGVEDSGMPVFRLLNASGETRLQAMLQGDDALLIMGAESGRAAIFGSVGDAPVLSMGDAGKARAGLQLDRSGSPIFSLFDSAGQRAIALSVDSADTPFLTMYEQGRSRAALGIAQQAVVLNLSDTTRPRLVLGVADDGWASAVFLDEDGQTLQELPLQTAP